MYPTMNVSKVMSLALQLVPLLVKLRYFEQRQAVVFFSGLYLVLKKVDPLFSITTPFRLLTKLATS